ncbi:MAG: UDP-3-O-(3-hydroxymyristoyl)glucosamine N-acyltransferase [Bacteroidetes bacterium]|jgi:UDP-3-O-[3-hydroxymyristoyl] glucosamine N-acyltransferase|nr:UDP-3-O-(3-hydroxymyristoyl)glucosamine N-acyltransferase [Bacteroidota bacterium]
MQLSAKKIAALLDGTVEGDPDVKVDRPSKIEEGGEGSISFLGNPKYEEYAYSTTASALLVARDFKPKKPVQATLVRVDNVYGAIAQLLERFGEAYERQPGISGNAAVAKEAQLGEGVTVGAFSSIGAGSTIGAHSIIHDQVYIGRDVTIGAHAILYPGVRILDRCQVGDHCILHSNVVVGSDGFGFTPQEDGSYKKVIHVGNVILEDHVEIGAQSAIDRGTMGSTIIREGVKMDNLIQVGHNVEIGAHTVIAAQTGIAGSTKIGKHCRIGGQVGFVGHLEIADGTQIQAQSGIASDVKEPNQALFGYPAFAYRDFVRSHAVFKRLPELYKKLSALEKAIRPPSKP